MWKAECGIILLPNPAAEFDRALSLWIHAHATPWLDRTLLALTHGGDSLTLLFVTLLCAACLLWRYQQKRAACLLLCGFSLSLALNNLLKLVFQRARPQLWALIPRPLDYSFPSGHAMNSLTVYGLLAFLLSSVYPQQRWLGWLSATGLVCLIGFSRVYLGVHWPTDVLAGFTIGSVLVTAGAHWFRRGARQFPHSPLK